LFSGEKKSIQAFWCDAMNEDSREVIIAIGS
jgi:hypothetical protein